MKKAGNLKYGFEHSTGDVIAVFDADFVPRPEYLSELVPYFDDEAVGIVQSPQFFDTGWGMNWLRARPAAGTLLPVRAAGPRRRERRHLRGHLRPVPARGAGARGRVRADRPQRGRAHRRQAAQGRPSSSTCRCSCEGLCPDTLSGFLNQQYRWCTGSMSLLGSAKFWKAKQPWRTRLCYMCGFSYYVHTALFTFVGPVIPLLLLSLHSETLRLRNYVWILPGIVYSLVLFPLWHRQSYRLEAWAVKMIYGWAHALALADILRGTRRGWQPTGAAGIHARRHRPPRLVGHRALGRWRRRGVDRAGLLEDRRE